jgi:hypothetical protein
MEVIGGPWSAGAIERHLQTAVLPIRLASIAGDGSPVVLSLWYLHPGALIRWDGRFHQIADPWRHPLEAVGSVLGPIGNLTDKLRVAALRRHMPRGSPSETFQRPERTTISALREMGFSDSMIDRFFRPFLGGVFLDPHLKTSSHMFELVFQMFASGDAVLPARGMGAIPQEIAAKLPVR